MATRRPITPTVHSTPKQGEIVIVALRRGVSVVRCLETGDGRITITMGRNKQAHVPIDRVVLATGLTGLADDQLEAFAKRVTDASRSIDLREVWDLIVEEGRAITLEEIAGLLFGDSADSEQLAGLVTHLETMPVYFERHGHTYTARTGEEIERAEERKRKQAERQAAEVSVIGALVEGQMPERPSDQEQRLVSEVRGFAVHGDEHPRAEPTKKLLAQADTGSRDLQQRAFELLVGAGEMAPDEPIEIERAGVPVTFPPEAETEAQAITTVGLNTQGRRDLTGTPLFTIDDRNTTDRDDALSVEVPAKKKLDEGMLDGERVTVGVHIADAGALFPVGGAVDREADRRMSTLYTPDMRVPMVPPALSEGSGSLNPGESRMALTLSVTLDDGVATDWNLFPSIVQSRQALAYGSADKILREGAGEWHGELQALNRAADALRTRREAAGALVLERPELSISVAPDDDGLSRVSVEVLPRSTPARRLVTEMMILCNVTLARFCIDNEIPAAYRSQPALDPDIDTGGLNDDPVAQYRLMGRLSPAEVSTEPARHHGLGVPAYLQATSPLRRYPDLVMQRQVSHILATGKPLYSVDEIASVAQRADVQLRELASIENQRRRYWLLRYFEQRLEEGLTDYEAVVLDTDRRGPPILELADYPFRVRAELYPGASSSDRVTLRLHDVDLWRRVPHFVVAV
jgi:exoribonuclease-2